jgi:hypothetical protein
MSLLKTFDEKQNFWQLYPQFKILGSFKELYESDKTKSKDFSSKVMWAIAFRLDPSETNVYRNIADDVRAELLAKDFIQSKDFKWDDYSKQMELYKDSILTQSQKSLITWNEIMSLRDRELKDFYRNALETKDIGLIVELDKILALTTKFFLDYKKIKEDVDKDQELIHRGAGKKIKSLSDSGEM